MRGGTSSSIEGTGIGDGVSNNERNADRTGSAMSGSWGARRSVSTVAVAGDSVDRAGGIVTLGSVEGCTAMVL